MKNTLATVAGLALAATASAQTVDLTGLPIPSTPTLAGSILSMTPVTGIVFDLNVVAIPLSWGSEIEIEIFGPDDFTFYASGGSDFADITFGWGNSSGEFSFAGTISVTGGAGAYSVYVFDSFDDGLNPDAFFSSGEISGILSSSITFIPTPGSAAILGLGGVAMTRRRRAKPVRD